MEAMERRPSADELDAAAELLAQLAPTYGLSELRHGNEPGEVVATLADGRTYFDVVEYESAVEAHMGWRPDVTVTGAPGARPGRKIGSSATHAA